MFSLMEITAENYPENAGRTEQVPTAPIPVSPQMTEVLTTAMMEVVKLSKVVDLLKRHLYYGQALNAREALVLLNAQNVSVKYPAAGLSLTPDQYRILHSVLGVITEAGEMAENIMAHLIDGAPLDTVNLMEEGGDVMWYLAIPMNVYGWTMNQVLQANIEKLKKRYPAGWTQEKALNRDVEAERKKVEDHM